MVIFDWSCCSSGAGIIGKYIKKQMNTYLWFVLILFFQTCENFFKPMENLSQVHLVLKMKYILIGPTIIKLSMIYYKYFYVN